MTEQTITKKSNTSSKTSNTNAPKAATRKRAKKTTTPPTSSEHATQAKHTPMRRPAKPIKLSCLDAAVQVMADAPADGMSMKQIVELMRDRDLWTSTAGKTPEATLYAGITREIGRKGSQARFVKVSRGRFVLS